MPVFSIRRRSFLGLAAAVITIVIITYLSAMPRLPNRPMEPHRGRTAPKPTQHTEETKKCQAGYFPSKNDCEPCPKDHFSLPGWISCTPYLKCDEIRSNIRRVRHVASGGVKHVYLAEWNSYSVALNEAHASKSDFAHDVAMLQMLTPHPRVNQPLGACGDILVTQYHPLSSGEKINEVLGRDKYRELDTVKTRFQLALDYVGVLDYLHGYSSLVMCDTNDLGKTLSQYLITEDLRLIVNDLDALPSAKDEGIKCGHRQIFGDFVAPEELWPYSNKPFKDEEMPGYNEKTDIWKIPRVVEFLLGGSEESLKVLENLKGIHSKCKENDPKARPTAKEVLEIYKSTWNKLN